jgi:hypothetical protein
MSVIVLAPYGSSGREVAAPVEDFLVLKFRA